MFFPSLSSAFAETKGSTPQRYAVSSPAPAVHVRVSRRPVVKRCCFPSGRAPPVDPKSLLRRPFRDGGQLSRGSPLRRERIALWQWTAWRAPGNSHCCSDATLVSWRPPFVTTSAVSYHLTRMPNPPPRGWIAPSTTYCGRRARTSCRQPPHPTGSSGERMLCARSSRPTAGCCGDGGWSWLPGLNRLPIGCPCLPKCSKVPRKDGN
jgi:hypothetical protein